MKKLAVLFLITVIAGFGTTAVSAKAIGGKLIYNKMMDDYSDADFENNISGGVFFEVGPSFYGSKFRPGFDWVTLENDGGEFATVYGLHLDWYWFFMQGKALSPFVGFGPALNYYNYEEDETDGDSDAGIEAFGGIEYNISGPLSLLAEIRLTQHDIAYWDARILKGIIGIVYYF